jgi:hypothetical protein
VFNNEQKLLYLYREECIPIFFEQDSVSFSTDETLVLNSIFNALNPANQYLVTFDEFIHALSITVRGRFEERCRFSFQIFDYDRAGTVSKVKVVQFMETLASIGVSKLDSSEIEQSVNKFFDQSVVLRVEDYTLRCLRTRSIFSSGFGIFEKFFIPFVDCVTDFLSRDDPYQMSGPLVYEKELYHFEIRSGTLIQFASSADKNTELGNISLLDCKSVDSVPDKLDQFVLTDFNGQQRYFQVQHVEERQEWLFCILLFTMTSREHRYNSFAPVRTNDRARWYVDGRETFLAMARAIESAREQIFITGWMLSPLLLLIRDNDPSCSHFRLDTLLRRKASQGVQIYIILWAETAIAGMNLESKKVKHYLKSLYPKNISVIIHPPNFPVEWTHHQKSVVIDQSIAFLGGIDLGWGRYDDYDHKITDINHCNLTFPGNDYCLPRISGFLKFNNKLDAFSDAVDRDYHPRMAWHDVHASVTGELAKGMIEYFKNTLLITN